MDCGEVVDFFTGSTPLLIAQARTTHYLPDVSPGIRQFAKLGHFGYCLVELDVEKFLSDFYPSRLMVKYLWIRKAYEHAAEQWTTPERIIWFDYDILWTGPRFTNLRRFMQVFYFTPYDILVGSGFPGYCTCAKYHSLALCGLIGLTPRAALELASLAEEAIRAGISFSSELSDQEFFIDSIPKLNKDFCILIRDLDEFTAHHRVSTNQPFLHPVAMTYEEKTEWMRIARRLYPLE